MTVTRSFCLRVTAGLEVTCDGASQTRTNADLITHRVSGPCGPSSVFPRPGLWFKAELYALPAPTALPYINNPSVVLPFSTLASRCMSGNHTKHWGGGSDINVSRKVLRETFFWAHTVQRTGWDDVKNSHRLTRVHALRLMSPHLLRKACSCSLFGVAKRRSLKNRHG